MKYDQIAKCIDVSTKRSHEISTFRYVYWVANKIRSNMWNCSDSIFKAIMLLLFENVFRESILVDFLVVSDNNCNYLHNLQSQFSVLFQFANSVALHILYAQKITFAFLLSLKIWIPIFRLWLNSRPPCWLTVTSYK